MSRRLADRYVLGRQIGAGGTARVHVATDERLGRQVAVKLHDASLVATADPAGRVRFLNEGRTTAGFNHPHAVTVFDAGEDGGDLYIVMEFVDGPSLAARLAQHDPLGIDDVLQISRQVLSALAAAHAAGIVHRDVKPANILIGAGGDTKLADFGIAKRFDELGASVTSTGMVVGTPRYLAPEQAHGHAATPASDVYSMGVVMFEMLTGRLPSEADTVVVSDGTPDSMTQRLRSLRPDVPVTLASAVAWALESNPNDRPATAAALLETLESVSTPTARSAAVIDPTLVMGAADAATLDGPAATEVLVTAPPIVQRPSTGSRSRRTATLVFAGLLLLLGAVVAVATLGSRDPLEVAAVPSATASPASAPAAAPSVVAAPAVTEPVVTEPVVPPPIETAPGPVATTEVLEADVTVVTLIPGFPATDDLEVFLLQIERDPDLLGQSGPELADELRKVLEQRGGEQRESAAKLREVLTEYVDDGEIPPAVGEALDALLAPIAKKE